MKRVYLASQSPRRAELLQQIGVDFERISAEVDESVLPGEEPQAYVERLAEAKAQAGLMALEAPEQGVPVLGSDTAVVVNGEILGKPKNREDALRMLSLLSGNRHQVITSVCLCRQGELRLATSVSEVHFRALSDQEKSDYWDSGEPEGKAGAYAIQGFAAVFVEQIRGSYSGVVGLPLAETWQLLEAMDAV